MPGLQIRVSHDGDLVASALSTKDMGQGHKGLIPLHGHDPISQGTPIVNLQVTLFLSDHDFQVKIQGDAK